MIGVPRNRKPKIPFETDNDKKNILINGRVPFFVSRDILKGLGPGETTSYRFELKKINNIKCDKETHAAIDDRQIFVPTQEQGKRQIISSVRRY